MQIAIDISPLHSPHSGRGIGIYTRNLVESLRRYGSGHSVTEFSGPRGVPPQADIVHFPYFDIFSLTLPLIKPKPTVVTVHDVIPLVFPDKFPSGMRGSLKWLVQKRSLFGARRIITDSECSKNDVSRITGISRDSIDTVYLAPDPAFKTIDDSGLLDAVRTKFSLPKQYILYVGDVNWNKNIPGLLGAFGRIRGQKEFERIPLVCVGSAFLDTGLQEVKEINRFIQQHSMTDSVFLLGKLTIKQLSAVYTMASVYIQPSYYEGFGLPVLEAMACGCPVVCTNTSSLPEIAGPAVRISPEESAIAGGITEMLKTDRQKQQRRQYEWVKDFTWKNVARETIRVYERTLA